MNGDTDSAWGVSHLSDMPITLSFGLLLLGALLLLLILRIAFLNVNAGVR